MRKLVCFSRVFVIWMASTLVCWAAVKAPAAPPPPVAGDTVYPYHEAAFTSFIEESYRVAGAGNAAEFYRWMERAYEDAGVCPEGSEGLTLEQTLERKRQELAALRDPAARTQAQLDLASWLHRAIKMMLPRFSLDRGYEFHYSVSRLERQCFLQSVLIAGLLQRLGVDAGVVMIFKNQEGQPSNLGHAAVVMKLANGRDVIVDASDPQPFMCHRGVFARAPGYHFLTPVYGRTAPQIAGYRPSATSKGYLYPRQVHTLDVPYLRSQFWYYRGERAEGGPLASHPTPEGLRASAADLEMAVQASPWNPLAMYMLGLVHLKQGQLTKAQPLLTRAYGLYSQDGFVPEGPRTALAEVKRRAKAQGIGPKK